MKKVVVFIDGSNFYHCCMDVLKRADVDFGAYAEWLVNKYPNRELVRSYYYTCPLPSDADPVKRQAQAEMFAALSRKNYFELRKGRLAQRSIKCRLCGKTFKKQTEKGVDILIGVDMVSQASRNIYDIAILVSGDSDLKAAVQAVKDLGKQVELATLSYGRSRDLVETCDLVHDIQPTDMTRFYVNKTQSKASP